MKTNLSVAFVILTFFSLSISASPPDPIITIPPILDEVAQNKMSDVARLRPKGGADVSTVSRVGLAKLTTSGANPHVKGFPQPVPVVQKKKKNEKAKLKSNAEGLILKPESEYAGKDTGLREWFNSYYIPQTRVVRTEVTEEEMRMLRVPIRPADDQLQVHENITYNKIGQRALVLDLYTPQDIAGSQARFVKFRWPHGFEFFDPAKDQLVILMADYLLEQQGQGKENENE